MKKVTIIFIALIFPSLLISSWKEINVNPESVTLNKVIFLDDSIALAVGTNGIVQRSKDSGNNWTVIQTPTNVNLKSVAVINDSTLIIVGSKGNILKSIDKGINWKLTIFEHNYNFTDIAEYNDTIVAISYDGNVIISNDVGINWVEKKLDFNALLKVYFHKSVCYIIGQKGLLIKSNDFLQTTEKIDLKVNSELTDIISFNEKISIAGFNNTFIQSENDFLNWNVLPKTSIPNILFSLTQISEKIIYAGATVYNGLQHAISTDSGNSWFLSGNIDAPVNSFCTSQNKQYSLCCGTYGKINLINNSDSVTIPFLQLGKTIKIGTQALAYNFISGIDAKNIVVSTANKLYISSDSLETKNEILSMKGKMIEDIKYISDSLILVLADSSVFIKEGNKSYMKHYPMIFHSTNKGTDWTINKIDSNLYYKKIHFSTSKIILSNFIRNYSISYDTCKSWVHKSFIENNDYFDINLSGNSMYAIGIDKSTSVNYLFLSNDDGESFSKKLVEIPDINYSSQLFTIDKNVFYLLIKNQSFNSYNYIYKTIDGGTNWNKLYSHFSDVTVGLTDINFFNSENGIIFGSIGIILQTTDSGKTWFKDSIPTQNINVGDIFFPDKSTAYIATNSGIFKYQANTETFVSDLMRIETNDLMIFPNPAKNQIMINYNNPEIQISCPFVIYNLFGTKQKEIQVYLNPGENSIPIDISDLPTGIYFATIKSGTEIITKQFVIMR